MGICVFIQKDQGVFRGFLRATLGVGFSDASNGAGFLCRYFVLKGVKNMNEKTVDWLEIERKWYTDEFEKHFGKPYEETQDEKEIGLLDSCVIDSTIHRKGGCKGAYRHFFEQAETILKRKATICDYHNLYVYLLNYETDSLIRNLLYELDSGEELPIPQNTTVEVHKVREVLDDIFSEFITGLLTAENMHIKEFQKQETPQHEGKMILPFITPEQEQRNIDNINGILLQKNCIKKHKDQYWITDNSSVPKIIAVLHTQIKIGIINTLEYNEIFDFIKAHIRNKNGKDLKDSVNTAKNRLTNSNNL